MFYLTGRVKRGDAQFECVLDTRVGGIFFDLAAMGNPVTETDFRDFKTTVAEVSVFHMAQPTRVTLSA